MTPPHPPRLLCLGLNPALDLTYRVGAIVHGEAQRVREVQSRPGGKATNVARVAALLGANVRLILPTGGSDGQHVRELLQPSGIDVCAIPIAGATRRAVAVVEDSGSATVFNEPGPDLSVTEVESIVELTRALAPEADVLILSGSVPSTAPPQILARLIQVARDADRPVILDTSGPHLRAALAAGPTLIKPNSEELMALVGASGREGARRAQALSPATAILASAGAEGMHLLTPGAGWQGNTRAIVAGNPTGAGDAAVAAAAIALAQRASWPDLLRAALGTSAAAVLEPVAGEVDPARVTQLCATAHLTPIDEEEI